MNAQKTPDGADKLKGSMKEAIGRLIGDVTVEAEGRAERDGSGRTSPERESPKSDVKPKSTTKP